MGKRVFAMACHPDDIEFMMGGTLFLLKEAGCELHYMNLATGSCGTMEHGREEITKIRRQEGMDAAEFLGATYHGSLTEDLEVYYTEELLKKIIAVVRRIGPDIMLVPSLEDYMEDHMNTARLAVTAGFCRGMPNYPSIPEEEITTQDLMLYHALPYGLHDGMRRRIIPEFYVDVTSVIDKKEKMLACHKSQKNWLDKSQGLNAYLITMREMTKEVGVMSKSFMYAEGWRRHSHLGYSAEDGDPLGEVLQGYTTPELRYEGE